MFCTFTLTIPAVFVLCAICFFFLCISLILFSPAKLLRYYLSDDEMVPWFQSSLLLPVSLLFAHSTCAEFLLWRRAICILKSSRLLSWSHFPLIVVVVVVVVLQVIAVRVSSLFARLRLCWTPLYCTCSNLFNTNNLVFLHFSVGKIRIQYLPGPPLWRHRRGLAIQFLSF